MAIKRHITLHKIHTDKPSQKIKSASVKTKHDDQIHRNPGTIKIFQEISYHPKHKLGKYRKVFN